MTIENTLFVVKIIYSFHESVLDKGEGNLVECFNPSTENYGLWQPVPLNQISYEETTILDLQGGIMKGDEWMFRHCINGGPSQMCLVIIFVIATFEFLYVRSPI